MKTKSGREVIPPNSPAKTKQAATKNQKTFDRWLMTEGIREAAINRDFHAVHLFAGIDQVKMTDAERTELNLYLFGKEQIDLCGIERPQT